MEKRNEVYQVDAKPGMRWLSATSDARSFIHMTLVAAHDVDGGWIAEKHVEPRFFGFLEKASCGESSSCTKPDHDSHLISSLADGFPKLTRIRSNQKCFRPSDVCRYASLHITPTCGRSRGMQLHRKNRQILIRRLSSVLTSKSTASLSFLFEQAFVTSHNHYGTSADSYPCATTAVNTTIHIQTCARRPPSTRRILYQDSRCARPASRAS